MRDRHTLTDGDRTMEIYHMPHLDQNAGMLIAYLPQEKIVVEANLFNPPAPNAPLPTTPNASNVNFYHHLQRLRIDATQIASVHGRVVLMSDFLKVVGKAQ